MLQSLEDASLGEQEPSMSLLKDSRLAPCDGGQETLVLKDVWFFSCFLCN